MKRLKLVGLAIAMASATPTFAGGLLTNTNQHTAFNRMMSREASIGIDGVYYNPAGVAFMNDGHHLSLNWQMAFQSRTIKNSYPLFVNNTQNATTDREFKGKAFAPVIPSLQYAYNRNGWSFQVNFALQGGGGKCEFGDGLGSFEKIVSETAIAASTLAGNVDQALGNAIGTPMQMFSSDQYFGSKGSYSFTSYMRGRQYYYGLSLGAARRLGEHWSVGVGVRGVYAMANYYGYVKDIKVGNLPLYQVLDPSKESSADIELNCDQTGLGITPILSVDFKTGRWNFSAKYEFKTRLRLKNSSVNKAPSIGNLGDNLSNAMISGLSQKIGQEGATRVATAVLTNQTVTATMQSLKTQFDTKLEEAIGEYEDGKKIAGDIPAYLTLGAGYSPIDALRINVGFHWFDDKNATSYNNRNKLLKHGTLEYNAGAEYDVCKKVTVSAGWQSTNYGLSDEYMDDKSYVVSSNSVAFGGVYHISKKLDLNVAYFHTFYNHKKTEEVSSATNLTYASDYTRNNNVLAVGVDFNF